MQIKTETKVGFFVLIAIAVLIYAALYLGAIEWHIRKHDHYIVCFQDASGLTKQADVKIAGVKVGWVECVALNQLTNQAEASLMINAHYKLYRDAQVEIHQESILGAKYLELRPGSELHGVLSAGSVLINIGREPVLVNNLAHKVDHAIVQMTQLIADNKQQINLLIQNLNLLAERAVPVSADLQRVVACTQQNLDTIQSITDKIDRGDGLLGKIVNQDDVYSDIKTVAHNLRQTSEFYQKLGVVVDSHFETMMRPSDNYLHSESKGYFGLRLHTSPDWFYLLQLIGSEKGYVVDRQDIYTNYYDTKNNLLDLDNLITDSGYALQPYRVQQTKVRRNTVRYSYQIGRIFDDLAVRFGVFEGSFGLGADYNIPLNSDNIRWVTTLEMFDFRGQSRLDDRRPHLKWMNRLFLWKHVYLTFGLDDFISQHSVNPFFGLGIRFGDDDLKLLLGKFSLPK